MRGLARVVGKDHKHISLLESDKISPTVDTLEQICRALDIEPWEAVAGMTKAELLASLPVQRASPAEALVRELVAKYGEEMVQALLDLAGKVTSPEEFRATLRVFKAMRGDG